MSLAPSAVLGIALSVLAALAFAGQYLCVRLGTDRGSVTDVMLISLVCNVVLIGPAALIVHYPEYALTRFSVLSFVAAGLSGSLLARLCMFKSVETIGASRTSPVVSANVFFATLLAIVVLGETLTPAHLLGIVLVVAGVAVISWETATDDPERPLREVGLSLLLPLAAAAFIGFEPIFVSMGLAEGTPLLPGFAIKATVATTAFLAYLRFSGVRPTASVRRTPELKWHLGAGVTSTVGIGSYFAALEVAPVVIVVPLLQTSPLLVVVLSAVFLPRRLERVTWRLVAAACVVVVGATVVSLSG
ncbi:MAG: DMT family transporter [Halalkalicoccus sp.]